MKQLNVPAESIPARLLAGMVPALLDHDACLRWLLQEIHGGRCACPECGQDLESERQAGAFRSEKRVCCKSCGRWFDYRTGTILSATTLSPREIILLSMLLAVGTPVREVAERLDLHETTVRDWRERLSIPGLRDSHTHRDQKGARRGGEGCCSAAETVVNDDVRGGPGIDQAGQGEIGDAEFVQGSNGGCHG